MIESISNEVLFSCPDHGHKLAEGGKQEQFSQRVRRSFIEKSASGIHHPGGLLQAAGHERRGTPDRRAGLQDQACHTGKGKGNQLSERPAGDRPAESTGAILYCFLIRTVYFERI